MAKVACSAPMVPPETGASKKLTPSNIKSFQYLISKYGLIDDKSTTVDPFFKFS